MPLAAKLRNRVFGLIGVQRLAVPAFFVRQKRDPVALFGLGDDPDRLVGHGQRFGVGAVNSVQIVAVDLNRVSAERGGTGGINRAVPAEVGLAALPQAVHVQNRHQIIKLVVAGFVHRLPDRAFRHFAVAEHDPDFKRQLAEVLAVQSHADAVRQSLPERAGRDIGVRGDVRVRVAFQPRCRAAAGSEILRR